MDCYPDLAERGGVMKPGGLAARFCHARNRAVFRNLDHLICLDEAMARLLCGHYARVNPDLPVTIIPNWEDAAFFPAGAAYEPWDGRGRLNLDGRFTVLYLGNMGYGHDFQTVLDAAAALKDEPVTFLFVGGGRHWQHVTEETQRRGLSNVVMHPYVAKDKTGSVMSGADCALVTLRDDILGIMSPSKIHSNLAMGLPLIYVGPVTSNVDEAIKHYGCGVSLRHGDSGPLVEFVRTLVRDPGQREALRGSARRAFESAYCDTATMPRFDAVIAMTTGAVSPIPDVPAGPARRFATPVETRR
jgi:glycosyltransferase involved in cell wall biosynthesis